MRTRIGKVEHYYGKIGVAAIILDDRTVIKVDDWITIKGNKTFFEQRVNSIEIDHNQYQAVVWNGNTKKISMFKGEALFLEEPIELERDECKVGLKVKERVREGDIVYTYIDDTIVDDMIEKVERIFDRDRLEENEVKLIKIRKEVENFPLSLLSQSVSLGPWLDRMRKVLKE